MRSRRRRIPTLFLTLASLYDREGGGGAANIFAVGGVPDEWPRADESLILLTTQSH